MFIYILRNILILNPEKLTLLAHVALILYIQRKNAQITKKRPLAAFFNNPKKVIVLGYLFYQSISVFYRMT